ncbi:hypothetical protein AAJ76_1000057441 [Vairimorpha ceranae]|uniref:Uncharacterized protein n=1 Tax=Vairimorpha ceranae TaxID=40302 RepID=A0A0F9WGZ0_9MICR|nr:hypothetical protein AAJ76_1000057441 [Vairimorpha ceranae]KKO75885.1 hypothetical protein AAJ76_1000057441 [Vairimorpha ceranae]
MKYKILNNLSIFLTITFTLLSLFYFHSEILLIYKFVFLIAIPVLLYFNSSFLYSFCLQITVFCGLVCCTKLYAYKE